MRYIYPALGEWPDTTGRCRRLPHPWPSRQDPWGWLLFKIRGRERCPNCHLVRAR